MIETLKRWADTAREDAHMTCEPWRERLAEMEKEMRAEIERIGAKQQKEQRQ